MAGRFTNFVTREKEKNMKRAKSTRINQKLSA